MTMPLDQCEDLPDRLARRCGLPLPKAEATRRFSTELSYGRHLGPPPHDATPAAVVILIYQHQGQWRLPLTLRPQHLPDHAGQICLPGGVVEPGEARREAAIRELREELGIVDKVRVLGALEPIYVYASNFCVTPWLASIDTRPAMAPSPEEVDRVLEPTLAHLLDRDNWTEHQIARGPLQFRAPHFAWQEDRIWGATAFILAQFVDLLAELSQSAASS
jgi:8-oxo-dGTP pyrophosphatase MutT (NUDIX family)